jgi:hypothetical protein
MSKLAGTAIILALAISLFAGLFAVIDGSSSYGSDGSAFNAQFQTSPYSITSNKPTWGLGAIASSDFAEVQTWTSGKSMVVVAKIRASRATILAHLKATANIFKTTVEYRKGVWSVHFVSRVKIGGKLIDPWYDGAIFVRRLDFFYALGSGRSRDAASRFVSSFKIGSF